MTFDVRLENEEPLLPRASYEGFGVRNDSVLDNQKFTFTARLLRLEELGEKAKKSLPPNHAAEFLVKGLWTLLESIHSEGWVRYKFHEQGSPESRAVERVCAAVSKEIPGLSTFVSSVFAESLGILGYRDQSLFKLLGETAREKRNLLTPAQVKRYLWSMSQLDLHDPRFVSVLVKAGLAADRQGRLTESKRSRIALSLAHISPESVKLFLREDFLDDTDCSLQVWTDKYHALLITKAVTCSDDFERRREIASMEKFCESNSFELVGEAALRRFLDSRKVEYGLHPQFNIAGIFPDLVLYLGEPDRIVAIELDGYHFHFSWGPDGRVRLGKDLIRAKVLEANGVEVVHITSREWNETPSDILFSRILGM